MSSIKSGDLDYIALSIRSVWRYHCDWITELNSSVVLCYAFHWPLPVCFLCFHALLVWPFCITLTPPNLSGEILTPRHNESSQLVGQKNIAWLEWCCKPQLETSTDHEITLVERWARNRENLASWQRDSSVAERGTRNRENPGLNPNHGQLSLWVWALHFNSSLKQKPHYEVKCWYWLARGAPC